MGKEVPEENSSSPNARFTISSLHTLRNNQYRIDFLEGDFIDIDQLVFTEENLFPGLELTHENIQTLIFRSRIAAAERISVKLIGNYLHSTQKLRLKLLKRGFSREVITKVIDKLTACSLLNDEEFARAWVPARLEKHPEGRQLLIAGLRQRGIDSETAKTVVSELIDENVEIDCINRLISWKIKKTELSKEKIRKLLISRGFSYQLINQILENC